MSDPVHGVLQFNLIVGSVGTSVFDEHMARFVAFEPAEDALVTLLSRPERKMLSTDVTLFSFSHMMGSEQMLTNDVQFPPGTSRTSSAISGYKTVLSDSIDNCFHYHNRFLFRRIGPIQVR
jgi:hypothetical protein